MKRLMWCIDVKWVYRQKKLISAKCPVFDCGCWEAMMVDCKNPLSLCSMFERGIIDAMTWVALSTAT
jgi:hypothetical protein